MVFEDKPATLDRLDTEPIIWLTTVRRNGQPQTSPVWFLRKRNDMLIYSLPDTARSRTYAPTHGWRSISTGMAGAARS